MTLLLLLGLGLGTVLGALGTLTGIGGGFLLMPALLMLLPDKAPGSLAVASLTVVFFNALSGTILSLRRDRVRMKTGLAYALLSLPLVLVGTQVQAHIDRESFSLAFGVFLAAGGLFLLVRPPLSEVSRKTTKPVWVAGAVISLGIGFLSGFFGVGGGFLFVPLLAFVLHFPVVEATATSQLIVGIGAAFALMATAGGHPLPLDPMLLGGLVAGVLVGAPLGTSAAGRWSPLVVIRILAGLLLAASVKFLWP